MADHPGKPELKVKTRRFLSSDYDFIADFIDSETEKRASLKARKDHEALWTEVDRQIRMKPMEVISPDPDDDWKSALELGDLSTAHEVLSSDVLRLIFPQERSWLGVHTNIDFDRLQNRQAAEEKQPISEKDIAKIQKKGDAELRSFMYQQHSDFGLRARVELSVKEALSHGSFVAEVQWKENQSYQMGGVFKSAASPVWVPHSMWNCYPETLELGVDLLYTGSMIIKSEKTYEWILRQPYINLRKFKDRTTDKNSPVQLKTYFGDLTVERSGEDVFLPNTKFIVANKTVLFAEPMNNISIIYGGYDRVDVLEPYYMSPLVKQSPNHKIVTILANRFLDVTNLKIEPPGTYDGNDATLVKMGGPKIIPGFMTPSKGGAQNTKFLDVGDPSWAVQAITYFQSQTKEGTGVSSSRAGSQRQADRVTATQIEEESAGGQLRTVDFVGKIEKAIRAFLYIQHELNLKKLKSYKFYNPEMGMKDFETIRKEDLPKEVHFEVVGSKGVLTERRRSQGMSEITSFLLGNERTAHIPRVEEIAMQMYSDVGVKNPERLLNIPDENDQTQKAIQAIQQKAQEVIAEMQETVKKNSQDLINKEMELSISQDKLELRNERALGTETHLREEIQDLKAQMKRNTEFLQNLGKIKDEKDQLEDVKDDIETEGKVKEASENKPEVKSETKESNPVIVNIEKSGGFKISRDENGDMNEIIPSNVEPIVPIPVEPIVIEHPKPHGYKIERDKNGDMTRVLPIEVSK